VLERMIARLTTLALLALLASPAAAPMTFRNIRPTIANYAYVTNSGAKTPSPFLTW